MYTVEFQLFLLITEFARILPTVPGLLVLDLFGRGFDWRVVFGSLVDDKVAFAWLLHEYTNLYKP